MSSRKRASGFTLVELVVVVVILGLLMRLALPSFLTMLRNSEVRNAADSIANGMQRARAEAVTRNANVSFTLGTGSGWTVADTGVIETRSASEGSSNVTRTAVAADGTTAATTVTFNSLGQVVPNAANLALVDLAATGANKALRVTLGAGGNAKVCDPSLAPGSNPRAC